VFYICTQYFETYLFLTYINSYQNKFSADLADASISNQGSTASLGADGDGQEKGGSSSPSNVAVIDDAINVDGDHVDVDGNPVDAGSTSLMAQNSSLSMTKSASPSLVAASPTGSKVSLSALSPNGSAKQLAAAAASVSNQGSTASLGANGDGQGKSGLSTPSNVAVNVDREHAEGVKAGGEGGGGET
jgi:hypothetical protein